MTDQLRGQLRTWQEVHDFIFAGNATFTLVSKKTGVRFTYRVKVKKEDVEKRLAAPLVTYFLSLLRGSDNERDYAYMGVLRKQPVRYFWTSASGKVGRQAPAYKALLWFLDCLTYERPVLGEKLEVWHEGKCGRCGRKLTVPTSIADGLGPECLARKMASPPPNNKELRTEVAA